MRQTGVIRYLVVAASLLFLAACGTVPGLRTSMPPTPAEPPPGASEPAPPPAPDLAQQVQNLQAQVQQMEARLAEMEGHRGAPVAARERRPSRPPPPPCIPRPPSLRFPAPGRTNIIRKACASITPRNTPMPGTRCTST